MGFNASQGSANVAGDEIENFELPPFCLPASQQPSAEFSSDVSTVTCGKSVKFTDASADAFEWLWNFVDMTTSSLQNPLHTFTSPGTYSVKLIVTNPLGSDSVIHTIIVDPAFSVSVTADPTDICKGEPVHLSASASGTSNRSYIVQPISYAPLSNTGTSVTLSDDQMNTAKPIGFTFNFFGLDYTQFYICSNGFITFSPSMPAAPVYGEAIPFTADPDNIIALAWNDLNPQNAGSSIRFYTTGIAPSRKLVVTYSTSHYGGVSYPFVVQAILYEGTNVIEIHTTTISNASSFDEAALTTQGIENADGSAGVAVPGRNGELFSAANDAYRFTPFISYAYNWMPGSLTGANQTVTPQSTGYYQIQVTDGTSCVETFQTQLISVTDDCLKLNLKVFIEGYYSGSGVMRAVLQNQNVQGADGTTTDTITAELHSDADPTNIMSSEKVLLGTDGKAACKFTGVSPGIPYWLVVRHRNGLETWSSSTLTLDTTGTIYDFSTSSSKAFGNNMTDVFSEGIWSIYTGDLNNDQFIDIFDFPEYDSDNQNFVSGVYVATDFNGDGFVDIFDFPVYDANNQNFVMTIKP
jgi:PKD repeat protein